MDPSTSSKLELSSDHAPQEDYDEGYKGYEEGCEGEGEGCEGSADKHDMITLTLTRTQTRTLTLTLMGKTNPNPNPDEVPDVLTGTILILSMSHGSESNDIKFEFPIDVWRVEGLRNSNLLGLSEVNY